MTVVITEVFCTLIEAAQRLQVERHTVARWVREGRLPAQRAGGVTFIERAAVELVESQRKGVL